MEDHTHDGLENGVPWLAPLVFAVIAGFLGGLLGGSLTSGSRRTESEPSGDRSAAATPPVCLTPQPAPTTMPTTQTADIPSATVLTQVLEGPAGGGNGELGPLDPRYLWASDFEVRGGVTSVKFPAGYKVRIMRRVWSLGRFEVAEPDEYVRPADDAEAGTLDLGIRTYDPGEASALHGKPRQLRLMFHSPGYTLTRWIDVHNSTGTTIERKPKPAIELSADQLGKDIEVVHLLYGKGAWVFDHVPGADDLKTNDFYAGLWIRLEPLTAEDRERDDIWWSVER